VGISWDEMSAGILGKGIFEGGKGVTGTCSGKGVGNILGNFPECVFVSPGRITSLSCRVYDLGHTG